MDPLTIGALAIGAYLIFGRKKKKKAFTPGTGDLPTDIPTDEPTDGPSKPPKDEPTPPGEPAHVPKDVIGGGWNWDEKNVWPTEGAIAARLVLVSNGGYKVGGNYAMPNYTITGVDGQGAVRQFQRDWNEVVSGTHWTLLTPANTAKPAGKLTVDGFIGKNTWKAMRWVFRHDSRHLDSGAPAIPGSNPFTRWTQMVSSAKALP